MPTADDAARRQAEITGQPPRIEAKRDPATLEAAREQMGKIMGAASGGQPPAVADADIPEMLLTAMCHRELFAKLAEVSLHLLKQPSLALRDRQLVILRVAWLRPIPYIWGEHVRVSKSLGLTADDIEQVTVGSTAACWNEHERALLQATEELVDRAMISDATWAVLARTLDDRQLFELPVLVGQFSTVGYFQNALRIPLAPGNEGLASR